MKLNLKKITHTVGLTLLLGLSSIGHAATTYSGKHDSASCAQITGWAWDSTQPTTPITVDIYDGSSKLTTLTADVFRQSLLDAGKGDGKHAFTFPTPASLRDGVAHSITIMIGGTQQKLTSSPKSITCGALYNIQSDHLGTPRVVVDQNNKVVWRNEGEPFSNGLPEQDVDADGKPFVLNLRFPGQYYDSETGRNQNFFRDYDPGTGRYTQSDPIGLRGGVNTFAYVEGQPTKFADPKGLVRWSGESYSVAAIPGVGGAGYWFDLKSQCINGRYAYIRVRAWGLGAGFGARLTGGVSGLTFDDGEADINPDGFAGTFRALGANAGAILVGGWTWYQLGSNFSDMSPTPSPGLGFDLSISGIRGKSKVVDVEWKRCNCD